MDNTYGNTFVPATGMEVYGSDGEKIGEIDAVEGEYFIVRKGFFFPEDHYIPMSAVASYDDNKVYLNVTKDGALEQEWGTAPVVTDTTTTTTTTTTGENYGQGTIVDRTVDTDVNREYVDTDVNVDRVRNDDTIEVVEEDLSAVKREVEKGRVGIHKDVVEEHKTIEVPVTEEEVNITRRAVDRPATGHDFEEGSIEVPLKGEEVELRKDARVVEEINIDKTARQHSEQVSGTVRREEVHVDGENIDVDRNAGYTTADTNYVDGDTTVRDDRNLLEKGQDWVEDKADDVDRKF